MVEKEPAPEVVVVATVSIPSKVIVTVVLDPKFFPLTVSNVPGGPVTGFNVIEGGKDGFASAT